MASATAGLPFTVNTPHGTGIAGGPVELFAGAGGRYYWIQFVEPYLLDGYQRADGIGLSLGLGYRF